jgi:hypothetical protein
MTSLEFFANIVSFSGKSVPISLDCGALEHRPPAPESAGYNSELYMMGGKSPKEAFYAATERRAGIAEGSPGALSSRKAAD